MSLQALVKNSARINSDNTNISTLRVVFRSIVLLVCFLTSFSAESQVFLETNNAELRLGIDIQYDAILGEDCSSDECDISDGLRNGDISSRYNYYMDSNVQLFADINFDLSDVNVGTDLFSRISSATNTEGDRLERDLVNRAIIGAQAGEIELSFGKQFPVNRKFGPTGNNYINFDLSGFDDDRLLSSNGKTDNLVSKVDLKNRYRFAMSIGLIENSSAIPNLNHELLLDFPLSESNGVYVSVATKSTSLGTGNNRFDSHGVRFSWFQNNGNTIDFALSTNDLGDYLEILFKRDLAFRHRLEAGLSDFNSDLKTGNLERDSLIVDSQFIYLNYTYSLSRTLSVFIEGSGLDSDDSNAKAYLGGLVFSF